MSQPARVSMLETAEIAALVQLDVGQVERLLKPGEPPTSYLGRQLYSLDQLESVLPSELTQRLFRAAKEHRIKLVALDRTPMGLPELMALWDGPGNEKEGFLPWRVGLRSTKNFYLWRCPAAPDHTFRRRIDRWAVEPSEVRCPFCSGRRASRTNSLATKYPKLAKEWHPKRNGTLKASDVISGTHRKVWWQCAKGHEWEAPVRLRTRYLEEGSRAARCPMCSFRALDPTTCLAATHPRLSRLWHPTKNGKLTPRDVLAGSTKLVWWRCSKGHESRAKVRERVRGFGCPFCAGRLVAPERSLAAQFPELSQQWHPTRNSLRPDQVVFGSTYEAWWKCPNGKRHVWKQIVRGRTCLRDPLACPLCSGKANRGHRQPFVSAPKRILALLDSKPARLRWTLLEFQQALPDLPIGTLKTALTRLSVPGKRLEQLDLETFAVRKIT